MIDGLLNWAAALWMLHPYTTWACGIGILIGMSLQAFIHDFMEKKNAKP